MRYVIYYRGKDFERDELPFASKHFVCVNSILDLQENDFVVSRFSLWPFFADQFRDLKRIGVIPINSLSQYHYVADLKNYVSDLKDITPETWGRLQDLPDEGPFIVKGATNSRKFEWDTMMFAKDKAKAIQIHGLLLGDSLIGGQEIYVRRFVPLKTFVTGLRGLPITKEFRFFIAFGKIVSAGYYWSSHVDDLEEKPDPNEVPNDWLSEAIRRVGTNSNFYAMDVAQTEAGNWIVIELNDGCSSGLSENNPEDFYRNLKLNLLAQHNQP